MLVQVGATARLQPLLQRVQEAATVQHGAQRLFSVQVENIVLLGCLRQRLVSLVASVMLDPVLKPCVL